MEKDSCFNRQKTYANFYDEEETVDFQDLLRTIGEFRTPARDIASWLKSALANRALSLDEQRESIDPTRIEINFADLSLLRKYQDRVVERDCKREALQEQEERSRDYDQEC